MDIGLSQALYPLQHCKTIHLVRHAQGVHNVEGEKDLNAFYSEELFDAHLTPLGWKQVNDLRKHVFSSGLLEKIELVIASPMLRTMQTAVGVFGGEGPSDDVDTPPLMVANAGNSNLPAIPSLNCPPFIALELCCEQLGLLPCNRRRSIAEYKSLFPAIDFSLIESEDDILWKSNIPENEEELAARANEFLNWLERREEKEIAVVTHHNFLASALSAFTNNYRTSPETEIGKGFKNCEIRSFVLDDKSSSGSDSKTTDYPAEVPISTK